MPEFYDEGVFRGIEKSAVKATSAVMGLASIVGSGYTGNAAKQIRALSQSENADTSSREKLSNFLNTIQEDVPAQSLIGGMHQLAISVLPESMEKKIRPLFAEYTKRTKAGNCYDIACVIEQSEQQRGNDTLVVKGAVGDVGHAMTIAGSEKRGWQVLDPFFLSHVQHQSQMETDFKTGYNSEKEMNKLRFGPMPKSELKKKLVKEGLNLEGVEAFRIFE